MAKPFKELQEQIEILKSRNLTIDDEENAKECLLLNNYYNIVNCYGKLLTVKKDTYINGAEFKEMMAIHTFDREIKKVFFVNTQIIENNFKSIVAYFFSLKGNRKPFLYFEQNNFDGKKPIETAKLFGDISKIIDNGLKDNKSAIYHYYYQHNDIPMWVLVNNMTFGQIIRMYGLLRIDIKNEINRCVNNYANKNLASSTIRLSDSDLYTILDNIKNVRNIVAHNNKMFDYLSRYNYPYINEVCKEYGTNQNGNRRSVFYTYVMMRLFLNPDQYRIMNNTIANRMKDLNKNLHSISANDVIAKLGFPENWYKTSKIK